MVNRKLKKKTLKKKSKNKTKKKYMNRRDIENLFMVSSFQKGGVDLYGGVKERPLGLSLSPTLVQVKNPQSEHKPPAWLPGGPKPNPSGMKYQGFVKQNQSEPHPTSVTSLYPLMTHVEEQPRTQEPSLSSTGSEQSSGSEQSEPHPTSATSSQHLSSIGSEQSREPILHQNTEPDDVTDEQIIFDPSKDIENNKCKTLLRELRIILENIINEFNSQ